MVRIIPWILPSVDGGSAGGYTPAPTPTPVVTDPYDLDGATFTTGVALLTSYYTQSNGRFNNFLDLVGTVTVSGVKILDASNVGQVIAECTASGAFTYGIGSSTSSENVGTKDIVVNISSVMSSVGGTQPQLQNNVSVSSSESAYKNRTDCIFNKLAQSGASSHPTATITVNNLTVTIKAIKVLNANGAVIQELVPE